MAIFVGVARGGKFDFGAADTGESFAQRSSAYRGVPSAEQVDGSKGRKIRATARCPRPPHSMGREARMAMTMTGEVTLPADRSRVWTMLNDPAVLKSCIPGCQSLEKTSDTSFAAVAKIKIGPVGATFKGKVQLSDIAPSEGYTISGEGEGGIAGFAKGGAKVALTDAEGGTMLKYDVEAHVGGKMAQLGSRLIDGVAKKMADQFFASFAAAVGVPAAP
jgi:carbon monoxide dehydrogenase subunit G